MVVMVLISRQALKSGFSGSQPSAMPSNLAACKPINPAKAA